MLINCLCHQCVVVGQLPQWPSSAVVLAAMTKLVATALLGDLDHGCSRCFILIKNFTPVKFMLQQGIACGPHKRSTLA